MKFKVTKKEMKSNYQYIVGIGYCAAQNLLNFEEPIAYSTRTEGWACDYYEIDGVLISTGYASLDNKNVKCDYKTVHNYDKQAELIRGNSSLSWEEQKEQVKKLLYEFIKEIYGKS